MKYANLKQAIALIVKLIKKFVRGKSISDRKMKKNIIFSLFDNDFYINQLRDNSIKLKEDEKLILHYKNFGWKLGLSPNKDFDVNWYLDEYSDVRQANIEPLEHYVLYGRHEGRQPKRPNNYAFQNHVSANHAPIHWGCKCSILTVVYKTNSLLDEFVNALNNQKYRNFELIIVSNGDNHIELKQANFEYKIIKTNNHGFAQGNNDAYAHCNGEIIVLLNDDAIIDSMCLYNLVLHLYNHSNCAAVAPKITFLRNFYQIRINALEDIKIDLNTLKSSLNYKKYFVRDRDLLANNTLKLVKGEFVDIDIPEQDKYRLALQAIDENASEHAYDFKRLFSIQARTSFISVKWQQNDDETISFSLSDLEMCQPQQIINNAGSVRDEVGNISDVGFGKPDETGFNISQDRSHFCGCCVAIKRASLVQDAVFNPSYFAYFEDSSTSETITDRGFKITYVPQAGVRHSHSATTVEKSAFWYGMVHRNRALLEIERAQRGATSTEAADEFVRKKLEELNHLYQYYKSNIDKDENITESEIKFTKFIPAICTDIKYYRDNPEVFDLARKRNFVRIGLYNECWNTLGGGEARALQIASYLQDIGKIDLISSSDFNLDLLCEYFGYESNLFNKRIIRSEYGAEQTSGEYDIFINSTFGSHAINRAKVGVYVVSFPFFYPNENIKFFQQKFVTNSKFTTNFCKEFWPELENSNIDYCYPGTSVQTSKTQRHQDKKPIILSVGRFTTAGHTKAQYEMVEVYRMLPEDIRREWKLVLMGSLEKDNKDHAEYFEKVKKRAKAYNIEVVCNAKKSDIDRLYSEASIYWHLAGYGIDVDLSPEKCEHFGIAVLDAVDASAYPIVMAGAGPEEIVRRAKYGSAVHSLNDVCNETIDAIENEKWKMPSELVEFSEEYQRNKFLDFLSEDLASLKEEKLEVKSTINAILARNQDLLDKIKQAEA